MVGLLLDGCREPLIYNALLMRMYAQQGLPRYLRRPVKCWKTSRWFTQATCGAPCLILRGRRDGIIPDTVARRLAAALPLGAFRRLDGAAHALQFSRPQEFVETALAFWERLMLSWGGNKAGVGSYGCASSAAFRLAAVSTSRATWAGLLPASS